VIKNLAITVGLGLLLATANLTIIKTTGYHDAHAVIVLAIAAGAGIGAWALGHAWGEGRALLTVLLALAMLSGELFGLAQTADRIAAERERQQGPTRLQAEAHAKASVRVGAAKAKLDAFPATTPRLTAAITKKADADKAVLDKSAERGCAKNCRLLLEQQVGLAQREIEDARAELQSRRQQAERELADARAALNNAPRPKVSGTPLADRLGIDPAKLDMIIAGFGTFGANGLAACLIAFGAHRRDGPQVERPKVVTASEPEPTHSRARAESTSAVALLPRPRRDPRQHTAEFSVRCLRPADADLPLSRLHPRYAAWCQENEYSRLPPADLANQLCALFSEQGIPIEPVGGELVIRGVALADPT